VPGDPLPPGILVAHHNPSCQRHSDAHHCVDELRRDISTWVQHWNDSPRPFIWRKTAEQILDTLANIYNESATHDTKPRSTDLTGGPLLAVFVGPLVVVECGCRGWGRV
jgi:hypothetical protein